MWVSQKYTKYGVKNHFGGSLTLISPHESSNYWPKSSFISHDEYSQNVGQKTGFKHSQNVGQKLALNNKVLYEPTIKLKNKMKQMKVQLRKT